RALCRSMPASLCADKATASRIRARGRPRTWRFADGASPGSNPGRFKSRGDQTRPIRSAESDRADEIESISSVRSDQLEWIARVAALQCVEQGAVHSKVMTVDARHQLRHARCVGQKRSAQGRDFVELHRTCDLRHAQPRASGLQQLLTDAVELRRLRTDDAFAIMEADVPDRCFGNPAIVANEQRVIESCALRQCAKVEKWKSADVLDVR